MIDESLQVLVREAPPPKGGQLRTLWHTKVPNSKQSGVSSWSMSAAPLQKVIGCMQGPCEIGETGETLDNPSMASVPLCTKLEMSDINKGN